MISFVRGLVDDIEEDKIIVDTGSIGYNVFVPSSVINKINRCGEEVKLYTYLSVREDAMVLFGFLTKDDLNIYKQLISVNGVGPKAGLSILSTFSAEELRVAILAGDSKAISKAQGIGAKTAQKIILELKDKAIIATEAFRDTIIDNNMVVADNIVKSDAMEALIALGYSPSDTMVAINNILKSNPEINDAGALIKLALKNL